MSRKAVSVTPVITGADKAILVAICFSGIASLIYEVVWTRALSLVMGSTTYALSTILGAFLGGLAFGSWIGGKLSHEVTDARKTFGLVELGIALFGLATFAVIKNLAPFYAWIFYTFSLSFHGFSIVQLIFAFLVMIVPTTLMGATFPLALKAYTKEYEVVAQDAGILYSLNTVGAVIGAMSAGFILIPFMGMTKSVIIAALLNAGTALFLISRRLDVKSLVFGALIYMLVLAAPLALIIRPSPKRIFNFYSALQFPSLQAFVNNTIGVKLLYEKEDVHGLVQVFRDHAMAGNALFMVNHGRIDSSTGLDVTNLLLLSFLPSAYKKDTKTFLNIGMGTGTTVKAASLIPGIDRVYSVEINKSVTTAVKEHFYPELFDKKSKAQHIYADARNYLQLSKEKFDVVSSEPSYPIDEGAAFLFTEEFFKLVKARLSSDGVYAQWVPGYLMDDAQLGIMAKTLLNVFPYAEMWSCYEDYIFIAAQKPLTLSQESIAKDVDALINKAGMEISYIKPSYISTYKLKYKFGELRHIADLSEAVNTDDRPLLNFSMARKGIGEFRGY